MTGGTHSIKGAERETQCGIDYTKRCLYQITVWLLKDLRTGGPGQDKGTHNGRSMDSVQFPNTSAQGVTLDLRAETTSVSQCRNQ